MSSVFGFCTVERAGAAVAAVLADARVVELADAVAGSPGSVREVLTDVERWTDAVLAALAGDAELPRRPETDVRFLPPVTDPSAIYCAGANYYTTSPRWAPRRSRSPT